MSERMDEDRLKELRRRGGLWTVEHALEFIREIDALKAEVREKDDLLDLADTKCRHLEAEVARLRGAYRESREVLEELMDETEDTALQARIAVMLTYQDDALRAGKDGE